MLAHLELVRQIAYKLVRRMPPQIQRDDLEAAGMLGLLSAATAFDRTRGVAFGAFARRRILGAMLDYLRADDALTRAERDDVDAGRSEFFVTQLDTDVALQLTLVDSAPWPDASAAQLLQAEHVRRAVSRLPKRERYVVEQHFYRGRDLAELTADLGVGAARVSQLKTRALQRLRRWLTS